MTDESIDLGDFGGLVQPCEAIPIGELWVGPRGSDADAALRAFGPGTTAGGRAEAGWQMVGRIADDGPVLALSRDVVDELIEHQELDQ